MSSQTAPALAVLIDTQNVSHVLADEIFRRIGMLGAPGIRRAYGDWSHPQSSGWEACLNRYGVEARQQFSPVAGKDVADMALIIDAMDLLHSGQVAGFCIVSSDSDFSPLAIRIRQQGLKVFGIGEAKTPQPYTVACDKFVVLNSIKSPPRQAAPATKPAAKPTLLPSKAPLSNADLEVIRTAIELATENGWAKVGMVGSYIARGGQLDIRKHATNLSKLLRVCGIAELSNPGIGHGEQLKVRLLATARPSATA